VFDRAAKFSVERTQRNDGGVKDALRCLDQSQASHVERKSP
jgi:hypothetical protein